jgi:uncharacterized protein YkwD
MGVRLPFLPMRRALVIAALAAGTVPAIAASASRPTVVLPVDSLENAVVAQLNQVRVAHGLRPLKASTALANSAFDHSLEMVDAGYFAHVSADGSPFWARIERFYGRVRPTRWLVGENLYWQAQSTTARTAVRAWLQSPEHRANVLRRGFREVGVSAVRATGAPGVYGGRRVVVLTVDFGTR